jgi:putative phosphoesterase
MKIAIISDIHANIYAFEAVLNELDRLKVDKVLVCGDLIGYYYWPKEVLDHIVGNDMFTCIRGNHEDILKETLNSNKASLFYRNKYGSGYDVCKRDLTGSQLDWLGSLPESLEVDFDGVTFFLSHGSLTSTNEYLYPDSSTEELIKNYSNSDFTVFGHTHYPFIHTHNEKCLLNPGSIGQPRDIGGYSSFVTISTHNKVVVAHKINFERADLVLACRTNDPGLNYLENIFNRGL